MVFKIMIYTIFDFLDIYDFQNFIYSHKIGKRCIKYFLQKKKKIYK